MAIFDDNVCTVLSYAGALTDLGIKRELLVSLVKNKARYGSVDVIALFYPNAYQLLIKEEDACNYLLALPLLRKLYDVASARGRENVVRLEGKPDYDGLEKIKRKIESFR